MPKDSGSLSTVQSIWDKIEGIESHPEVKKTVDFLQNFCKESSTEVSIEHESNGYLLVSISSDDLWMLRFPAGNWQRVYIGYDAEYSSTVLEQKYGYTKLLDAYIEAFEKTVPIYGILLQ